MLSTARTRQFGYPFQHPPRRVLNFAWQAEQDRRGKTHAVNPIRNRCTRCYATPWALDKTRELWSWGRRSSQWCSAKHVTVSRCCNLEARFRNEGRLITVSLLARRGEKGDTVYKASRIGADLKHLIDIDRSVSNSFSFVRPNIDWRQATKTVFPQISNSSDPKSDRLQWLCRQGNFNKLPCESCGRAAVVSSVASDQQRMHRSPPPPPEKCTAFISNQKRFKLLACETKYESKSSFICLLLMTISSDVCDSDWRQNWIYIQVINMNTSVYCTATALKTSDFGLLWVHNFLLIPYIPLSY
jgi:hypothetical protein